MRRHRGGKLTRQLDRQLQQREGVARRRRKQRCFVRGGYGLAALSQQTPCSVCGERSELEPWKRIERRARIGTKRRQHGELLSDQPPRSKGEGLRGRAIEPVRVVHGHQHRRFGGRLDEQRQRPGTDREHVRLAFLQRERRGERPRLHRRDSRQQVEHGAEERVQAGEGDLRLRLDSDRAEDAHVGGERTSLLEQGGLAQPGIADHDQYAAAPASRFVEQRCDAPQLSLAPDEHTRTVLDPHD